MPYQISWFEVVSLIIQETTEAMYSHRVNRTILDCTERSWNDIYTTESSQYLNGVYEKSEKNGIQRWVLN